MLFANWLDVPDAMAFLDAFAEAAEKTRAWKLHSVKTDFGHQFVYVRYTGRKFAGKGLMASAFAPVHQYRDTQRAANFSSRGPTRSVNVPPIQTPSASDGRLQYRDRQGAGLASDKRHKSKRRGTVRATPARFDLRSSPFDLPLQRVNLTLRADEWPTHVCFDQSAECLLAPLLKSALQSFKPRPPLTAALR